MRNSQLGSKTKNERGIDVSITKVTQNKLTEL